MPYIFVKITYLKRGFQDLTTKNYMLIYLLILIDFYFYEKVMGRTKCINFFIFHFFSKTMIFLLLLGFKRKFQISENKSQAKTLKVNVIPHLMRNLLHLGRILNSSFCLKPFSCGSRFRIKCGMTLLFGVWGVSFGIWNLFFWNLI